MANDQDGGEGSEHSATEVGTTDYNGQRLDAGYSATSTELPVNSDVKSIDARSAYPESIPQEYQGAGTTARLLLELAGERQDRDLLITALLPFVQQGKCESPTPQGFPCQTCKFCVAQKVLYPLIGWIRKGFELGKDVEPIKDPAIKELVEQLESLAAQHARQGNSPNASAHKTAEGIVRRAISYIRNSGPVTEYVEPTEEEVQERHRIANQADNVKDGGPSVVKREKRVFGGKRMVGVEHVKKEPNE